MSVSGWAFAGTPDGSVPERTPHADAVSPASTQSNVMESSGFPRLKPVCSFPFPDKYPNVRPLPDAKTILLERDGFGGGFVPLVAYIAT